MKLLMEPEPLVLQAPDEPCSCEFTMTIEQPTVRTLREGCPVHDPYFEGGAYGGVTNAG